MKLLFIFFIVFSSYNIRAQISTLDLVGVYDYKIEFIDDSSCKLIYLWADTAVANNYAFSLDNQKFKYCKSEEIESLQTDNSMWSLYVIGKKEWKLIINEKEYPVSNNREIARLPDSIKARFVIMALVMTNFKGINCDRPNSPQLLAKRCGIWNVHTPGLTLMLGQADNGIEAEQFAEANPNCRSYGQSYSCWGDQHICIVTTSFKCSCRFTLPIIGIGF
ncbi:MAG: hypothetical protein KF829_03880 [Ferruginibacter sp.]|nr:hypothetical protein [Ferruginibacter sp.]